MLNTTTSDQYGGTYFTDNTFNYALVGELVFAEGIETINPSNISGSYGMFYYAELEKFTLPATLKNIGGTTSGQYGGTYFTDNTFNYALVGELVFAEGIETINPSNISGSYGMFYYASIGKITLPSTLEKIGNNAFYYLGRSFKAWKYIF